MNRSEIVTENLKYKARTSEIEDSKRNANDLVHFEIEPAAERGSQ